MPSRVFTYAADAVVLAHGLWVLFLVGGFIVGRRLRWLKWLHIAGLGYSVLLQAFSWTCPLTYLEVWLRSRARGEDLYSGSFLIHYLEQALYVDLPREWLFFLTGLIIGVSAVVYYNTIPPPSHSRPAHH